MSFEFDPETARLTALTALRAWARQRDGLPAQRAALLATAWRAGERNVRELARIADVSRQTVYDDLRSQDIDPANDRGSAIDQPEYAPLTYEQVSHLAEHVNSILLPSMLADKPEPLAEAAWMASKALRVIAGLLSPDPKPSDDPNHRRVDDLDDLAACGEGIRRAAHEQWASEADPAELARFTQDAEIGLAELGEAVMGADTTMTVLLPDGMTPVRVTLSTAAGPRDPGPEGWTTWTCDAPLPLAPIDGVRHLEITSLLADLREVITRALHPELLEDS